MARVDSHRCAKMQVPNAACHQSISDLDRSGVLRGALGTRFLTFPYRGSSMHGTFRRNDVLLVAPASPEELCPGDVIAFGAPGPEGDAKAVVHRVQAKTLAGLITKGDRKPAPDEELVHAENLMGRVCFVQRDGVVRRVWGGRAGRLWVRYLGLRRRIAPVIGRLYALLRSSGVVRRLWQPRVTQVHLATEDGPLIKYVCQQQTVAHWWPEQNQFWCRKPYDLILKRPGERTD